MKVGTNTPPVELFWSQMGIVGTGGWGQLSKCKVVFYPLPPPAPPNYKKKEGD